VVHDSILHKPPVPVRQLNSTLPPKLVTTIDKALEKERERRYQTAAELGNELEQIKDDTDPGRVKARAGKRRWHLRLALAAVALVAALALAWFGWRRLGPKPKFVKRQLTFNSPGNKVDAGAISPDGKYVAYHDQTGLYVRNLESDETHLVGLPGALPRGVPFDLRWFPGGQKLLAEMYGEERDIWMISATGQEEPRLLYRRATGASISPDGRMIAFVSFAFQSGQYRQNEIWIGDINGNAPRKLVAAAEKQIAASPVWSPDGQWIAYGRAWETSQGSWSSAIELRPATGGPLGLSWPNRVFLNPSLCFLLGTLTEQPSPKPGVQTVVWCS